MFSNNKSAAYVKFGSYENHDTYSILQYICDADANNKRLVFFQYNDYSHEEPMLRHGEAIYFFTQDDTLYKNILEEMNNCGIKLSVKDMLPVAVARVKGRSNWQINHCGHILDYLNDTYVEQWKDTYHCIAVDFGTYPGTYYWHMEACIKFMTILVKEAGLDQATCNDIFQTLSLTRDYSKGLSGMADEDPEKANQLAVMMANLVGFSFLKTMAGFPFEVRTSYPPKSYHVSTNPAGFYFGNGSCDKQDEAANKSLPEPHF